MAVLDAAPADSGEHKRGKDGGNRQTKVGNHCGRRNGACFVGWRRHGVPLLSVQRVLEYIEFLEGKPWSHTCGRPIIVPTARETTSLGTNSQF
jgi:hypothetical protein